MPNADCQVPIENRSDHTVQRDMMLFNRQSPTGNRQSAIANRQ